MTKTRQDIRVYQGDAIEDVYVDVEEVSGGEDLTTGKVIWEMARSKHTDVLVSIDSNNAAMSVNTDDFYFKVEGSDTDRPPGTYWHQAIYQEKPDNDFFTLMTGEVKILERI